MNLSKSTTFKFNFSDHYKVKFNCWLYKIVNHQPFLICWFKGGVNPEIVKTIARCNFVIITVMYIKVYISEMEMSQRIRF